MGVSTCVVEAEDLEEVTLGVAAVAAAIARTITLTSRRWPNRPAEHPTDRTGVRVLGTPDYDVWLLRWPVGTGVTPHDHGMSIGAFCVVDGSLLEHRWRAGERTSRVVGAAETVTIGQGAVHDVIGVTDGSLSVHVYSPPLASMNFYDDTGTVVVRSELVESDSFEEPEPAGPTVGTAGNVGTRLARS
jgi:hypothetical protein